MIVKGNLLIDQYGNLLKVNKITFSKIKNTTYYDVTHIIKLVDTFSFRTSFDIIEGRVKKATKSEVKARMILYGR